MSNPSSIIVIIPVYNGECYLAEAIESVLAQTYRSTEIIVVDDGSTDDTAGVVKHFGEAVLYHRQPNGGAGAARNRGVELAHGEFVAFLDADDIWLQEKLTHQTQAFKADPALAWIFHKPSRCMCREVCRYETSRQKESFA